LIDSREARTHIPNQEGNKARVPARATDGRGRRSERAAVSAGLALAEGVAEERRDGCLDGGAAVPEGLPARWGGGRALQDGRCPHRKGEAAFASAGWLQADALRQQEVQRNRRLRQKRLQGARLLEFLARKLGERCQILSHAGHQPSLQGPIQKGLHNF